MTVRESERLAGRHLSLDHDRVALLFFREFERDTFVRHDRYIKRLLRPIYHRFFRVRRVTGFGMWCQLLMEALREIGWNVRLNDYRLAMRNPGYPVGLIGYPPLLAGWTLRNPALLGPGLYDHPLQAPHLMEDPRYKLYLVTCDWMEAMFRPVYGEVCVQWKAGIDPLAWPDTRMSPKTNDILIYDKIRWNRSEQEAGLLRPILTHLGTRGLSHEILVYGRYEHRGYRAALSRARAMIFLCEHETQGMAYQEALASNVPVLAWDNGHWLDPRRAEFEPEPVPATSVPYFSIECGERFRAASDFPEVFDGFWSRLLDYQPRQFVERELSLRKSAETYVHHYRQVLERSSHLV